MSRKPGSGHDEDVIGGKREGPLRRMLTVVGQSPLDNEPYFTRGELFAAGDLVGLFRGQNDVLVAGEGVQVLLRGAHEAHR